MIGVAAVVGGLGLAALIFKETLIGFLIGIQLLVLGSSLAFVGKGIESGTPVDGQVFGLFIGFSAVSTVVACLGLAVRLFSLAGRADMSEVRDLKK